jgi:hypothetical protein
VAVAHDASSESHTGTTGSTAETSFSWTHTPAGTPRGVVVFVCVHGAGGIISSITYGGAAVTAVSGGEAADTAGEGGACTAYFLGSSVPTGAQSIVVNRTNNATIVYAAAVTVTAAGDTDVAGVTLIQEDGTLAEVVVDDGSPGADSMRYGGIMSGLASPPAAGANSTVLQDIDLGARGSSLVRENTAGQGSRSVGWSSGTIDDRAAVLLAVVEIASGAEHTVNRTDSVGLTDTALLTFSLVYTDSAGLTDTTALDCSLVFTDSAGLIDSTVVDAPPPSSDLTFVRPMMTPRGAGFRG